MIEIQNLKTHFPIYKGAFFKNQIATVKAVDGVSFSLKKGEVLGLVGESGCGKSTLGRTILRLIDSTDGRILLDGKDISRVDGWALRQLRPQFQMIFQDPYASLNPRMTVFNTLAEPLLAHGLVPKGRVGQRVAELMQLVGLAPRSMKKYPHEFSGGQRQRIAIARALALEPKLIIADEPVSALDVSIQAQILNLLSELQRKLDLTMIFISHDLSVVRHVSNRIAVMYLGKIVEIGDADEVFARPEHPYTRALMSAVPVPDPRVERERAAQRVQLSGELPSPLRPPLGCAFHPRCPIATEKCRGGDSPELREIGASRKMACIRV